MSIVHKISLEDLTPENLENWRAVFSNATLEVVLPEQTKELSESDFWELIGLLNWENGRTSAAVIEPLVRVLARASVPFIYAFQERLAEFLYQLDQQQFAEHLGEERYRPHVPFDADNFLAARAAIVANGKHFFQRVLADPTKMPGDFTFEAILSAAQLAYERKTNLKWNFLPKVSYETFSNTKGWGGKTWKDRYFND